MDGAFLLQQVRKTAGVSQEQMAAVAGVSQQAVSRWERGTVALKVDTLVALADAVHVQLLVDLRRLEPDNSLGPLIDQQLALSPQERVQRLVQRARFTEQMRAEQDAAASVV